MTWIYNPSLIRLLSSPLLIAAPAYAEVIMVGILERVDIICYAKPKHAAFAFTEIGEVEYFVV